MKNMKIGKKLFVTFVIILGIFLATLAVSLFGLRFGSSQFTDFYSYSYPLTVKTTDIRRGIQTSIKALGLSMLTDDVQETQSFIEEVNTQMAGVQENLNFLLENYRGDTGRIQSALDMLIKAKEYRMQVQELAAANKREEASDIFFNQYNPLVLEVGDLMEAMNENTVGLADTTYESASRAQTVVVLLAVVVSIIAVLITIFMAIYLTKMIKRPIAEIETAAKDMANGNLNVSIVYKSRDELDSLSENMRTMTGRIKYYMDEIAKATQQVAGGDLNV